MILSEHNPFGAFGVVDPAIATERTGLDFLKSMLERRAPSCERLTQALGYCAVKERCFIPAGA